MLFFSLMYFYRSISFKVFVYGTLLTGLLTWIIARKSYHIGASGIIYMLFSFFLSRVTNTAMVLESRSPSYS